MTPNSPVIRITDASKQFIKKNILEDISLEAFPAETFGFLGPSGSA